MRTRDAVSAVKWAFALALATGCGAAPKTKYAEAGNQSRLDYLTFGAETTGLVAHSKQPTLKACLTGVDSGGQDVWISNIKSVIGKWVGTMSGLTSEKLAASVEVLVNGRDCDVDVSVEAGTWSNTNIGDHPTVHMGDSGYFASYNVMLHEFGHAFALGDTYQNGQSGNCQPGQPQAVMCNTTFDAPQADDIKGIAEIFQNAFPNDKPGNPANPGNPPNPPSNPPANAAYALFAALGQDLGSGVYAMKIGVTGASLPAGGVVEICAGGKADCTESTGTWTAASLEATKSDAMIFSVASQPVAAGKQVTLRLTYTGGATLQTIEFRG